MRYRRVLEEARGMVLIDKIEKEPRMNRIQKNVLVRKETLIQVSWHW